MLELVLLESLVPILVQGVDARAFMQGQLTGDLKKLSPGGAVWGAHCSAQGRVQMMVTMLEREEGIVALFDAGSAESVLARLRAGILGSKVAFESLPLAIAAASASRSGSLVDRLPEAPGECRSVGDVTLLRWWGAEQRYLLVAPQTRVHPLADPAGEQALAWRRGDVMAGLPRVFPETKGAFVPQMLNLDLLKAVSYDKGCYVGQEVVARARRGGVPRRMFRFSAVCAPPPPGTAVVHDEADVGLVVDAVASDSGCDLLAVVDLDRVSAALRLRGVANAKLSFSTLPYDVPRERR